MRGSGAASRNVSGLSELGDRLVVVFDGMGLSTDRALDDAGDRRDRLRFLAFRI